MRSVEWDGRRIPRLGFGCGSVLGRVGRGASLRAMQEAWELGVRLFDTARSYGYGEAEGLLGEFLAGRREQAIIVTKFGVPVPKLSAWRRGARPLVRGLLRVAPGARAAVRGSVFAGLPPRQHDVETMRTSLERSLRALRTEYVDVLLAHEAPATMMEQEDLLAALEALVRAGKVRRAGIAGAATDAAWIALHGPRVLSVVQYPAWEVSSWPERSAPVSPGEARLRMANHPFGGRAAALARGLAAMERDPRVDAALREKLHGDPRLRVAEFCLAHARESSQPHVMVASMLQLDHLRANVAAMASERFTPEDVATVSRWMTILRLWE